MSEVTEGYGAKCPCGGCEYHEGHAFYTDGPTNDYWGSGLGTAEDKDAPETVVSFCPWCGAKLFAGGKTQAPATEVERADALRFKALNDTKSLYVFTGHNGPVVSYLDGAYYGPPEEGGTLADAVDAYMAAQPQA